MNSNPAEESKQQIRIDVTYATVNAQGSVDEADRGMVRVVYAASETVVCQVATNKVADFHKMHIK